MKSGVVGGGHRQTAHWPELTLLGPEIVDETPKHICEPRFSNLGNGVKAILEPGCEDDVVED